MSFRARSTIAVHQKTISDYAKRFRRILNVDDPIVRGVEILVLKEKQERLGHEHHLVLSVAEYQPYPVATQTD